MKQLDNLISVHNRIPESQKYISVFYKEHFRYTCFPYSLITEDSRSLTPPYGDCNEKAMDQKSCISECYRRSVQFHCHCRPFWFSDDSQGKHCLNRTIYQIHKVKHGLIWQHIKFTR